MKLSPVNLNSYNRNQNQTCKKNNTSFKGVTHLELFLNCKKSFASDLVDIAGKKTADILFKPANGNDIYKDIKNNFTKFDMDYEDPRGNGLKKQLFQVITYKGTTYLLTGREAAELHEAYKTLGKAKKEAKDTAIKEAEEDIEKAKAEMDTMIKNAQKAHAEKIREIVNKNRIKESKITDENGITRYDGKELLLRIYANDTADNIRSTEFIPYTPPPKIYPTDANGQGRFF